MTSYAKDCGDGSNPLVVPVEGGGLRGYRTWAVDLNTGHLKGFVYPQKWFPGENEAVCAATKNPRNPGETKQARFRDGIRPVPTPGFEMDECRGVARGDHGCGFFADHSVERLSKERYIVGVHGVVEMYGQVELGEAGLRASRARIVALVDPKIQYESMLINQAMRFPSGDVWDDPAAICYYNSTGQVELANLTEYQRTLVNTVLTFQGKTRALYPDIPVYSLKGHMLEDFPVTDLGYLCNPIFTMTPEDP